MDERVRGKVEWEYRTISKAKLDTAADEQVTEMTATLNTIDQRLVENTFYRLNHSQVNFFRYHQLTWLNHVDVELASKVDLKILRAGPN